MVVMGHTEEPATGGDGRSRRAHAVRRKPGRHRRMRLPPMAIGAAAVSVPHRQARQGPELCREAESSFAALLQRRRIKGWWSSRRSRTLLDVVVRKSAAILKLLSGEDQALLVGRDALLVLDLGLHIVDGVGRLHLQGDGLARQGLDKNLHGCSLSTTPGAHSPDRCRRCAFRGAGERAGRSGGSDAAYSALGALWPCGDAVSHDAETFRGGEGGVEPWSTTLPRRLPGHVVHDRGVGPGLR